ncbi:hypothetical protein KVP40.0185 [Vibrio phage KVP40]|uniref:Uncharacterized protein n=2 Tax=Schizotequatrovirus KVP40 TaxID=1914019 RepID=Q6WHW9_BPKVM|nr:hypothetical protein KVP40.0185 [Vibrio phage KVP40]AAQ64254.1 hypothetical protein KVP40.0185 [Vibrio phage KVP40]AFN37415.1 hypothetical protein pp2_182 [Vibrio phage phi-pp2]WOL24718.1 hypothetical protein [Vibrio phage PG216]
MIYRFWKTPDNICLIEMTDDHANEGTRAYMTDMHDLYNENHGRYMLLGNVHSWGTIDFTTYDIRELRCLGSIETEELTLSAQDKSVLSRTVGKEGFDYAMLHYSDYQSVEYNVVESREFHALRNNLINARTELETWLQLQGIVE